MRLASNPRVELMTAITRIACLLTTSVTHFCVHCKRYQPRIHPPRVATMHREAAAEASLNNARDNGNPVFIAQFRGHVKSRKLLLTFECEPDSELLLLYDVVSRH